MRACGFVRIPMLSCSTAARSVQLAKQPVVSVQLAKQPPAAHETRLRPKRRADASQQSMRKASWTLLRDMDPHGLLHTMLH